MEHTEEQSVDEETHSKESRPAGAIKGTETLAITSGSTQDDTTKERKVIKKKAKKPEDGKENISVVSTCT